MGKDKPLIALFLGFVIVCFAFYVMGVGYHSVDLAQNMKLLNCEFDLNLIDVTNQGKVIDPITMYNMGWWQTRVSFMLLFIGTFVFAVGFSELIRRMK